MNDKQSAFYGETYVVTHVVKHHQSGVRLDQFLKERYNRRSREALKRAIDSGAIQVVRPNDSAHHPQGKSKASQKLLHGDQVLVTSRRKTEPEVNLNYSIVFEDDFMVVINKPPKLPVHPAGRFFFNTLLVHLQTNGFELAFNSERTFYPVHRLDKETSGIIIFAKTKEAATLLTNQFKFRTTEKQYLAIVHGEPKDDRFSVSKSLGKNPRSRIGLKMYPMPTSEGGQEAHTDFQVLDRRNGFAKLACFPRTGRQHQIRAHADLAGFPLVGDKIYGLSDNDVLILLGDEPDEEIADSDSDASLFDADDNLIEEPGKILEPTAQKTLESIEASLPLPRHALHAAGIKIEHPKTKILMTFEAPLPEDLSDFYEGLLRASK